MFGFEYALYSFASAIICSLLAKKNNKDTNTWWLAGLLFGLVPAIWLLIKPSKSLA